MKRNITLLGVAGATLLGIAAIPSLANGPSTPTGKQADSQTQTFVGLLEGTNEPREWVNLIIYDDTRESNFYLDEDWKSEKYVGHVVKITGTLDQKNRIIHVLSIEEVK